MTLLIIIGILALAIVAWWSFSSSRTTKPAAVGSSNNVKSPFHAVEVVCPGGKCQAAAATNGNLYLSREAPTLPLPGCTQSQCNCRYRHHDDRRAGDRRSGIDRAYHQISETLGTERRHVEDRRQLTT